MAKERDFVFIRMKERFLVPDHTVRDISGASFAGEPSPEPLKTCELLMLHRRILFCNDRSRADLDVE